jgi:hypothetical protein
MSTPLSPSDREVLDEYRKAAMTSKAEGDLASASSGSIPETKVKPATALPWSWGWRKGDIDAPGSIYSEKLPGHCYAVAMCPRYGRKEFAKDAAYATHACNAYPKLIYALRDARIQINYLHEKFTDTGTGNATLAFLESVLRELGELE